MDPIIQTRIGRTLKVIGARVYGSLLLRGVTGFASGGSSTAEDAASSACSWATPLAPEVLRLWNIDRTPLRETRVCLWNRLNCASCARRAIAQPRGVHGTRVTSGTPVGASSRLTAASRRGLAHPSGLQLGSDHTRALLVGVKPRAFSPISVENMVRT